MKLYGPSQDPIPGLQLTEQLLEHWPRSSGQECPALSCYHLWLATQAPQGPAGSKAQSPPRFTPTHEKKLLSSNANPKSKTSPPKLREGRLYPQSQTHKSVDVCGGNGGHDRGVKLRKLRKNLLLERGRGLQ